MSGGRRWSGRTRTAPALVVLAVAVLAVVACGVPTDDRPRPIREEIPFGLLDPPPPPRPAPTSTTSPPASDTVPVTVYLVKGDRLAPVERRVPGPPSVPVALLALLNGVTDEEAAAGLRSAIGIDARLLTTEVAGDIVRLNLAGSFAEIQGGEQVLAVAQLALTATSLEGVRGATFALNGRPVEVPTADGTLKGGPVGPGDFAALLAP